MTNIESLCGEGIGLDLHVGAGDFVHETRLAHVGIAAHDEGAGGGVDAGETSKMLAHLLQVGQTGAELADDGAHTSEELERT